MLSSLPYDVKHPIVLPKKGPVTELVISLSSTKAMGSTQSEIRSAGYWIIGGSSAVSNHISKCVSCQMLRSSPQEQKMANMPDDRIEPAPPFTSSCCRLLRSLVHKKMAIMKLNVMESSSHV